MPCIPCLASVPLPLRPRAVVARCAPLCSARSASCHLSPLRASRWSVPRSARPSGGWARGAALRVRAASGGGEEEQGGAEKAAVAVGAVAIPITAWSLVALKTTGCGLPPGPGGSLGAIEGVSYLALVAIVAWSAVTKAKTGTGLPAGKYGLLGAVEGFAYLILLAGIVVAVLNSFSYGFIPSALPDANCFGG